jgi:hypothetical protein
MSYKHELDNRGSSEIGTKSERKFMGVASKRGFNTFKSTKHENKILGIDVWLEKDKIKKGFDVKARKKLSASDKNCNDEWTLVEYRNEWGYDGWLLKKANYIAFEKETCFLVVDRVSLFDLCESLINKEKEYAKRSKDSKYIFYNRKKQELTALIKTSDILKLKRCEKWNKNFET